MTFAAEKAITKREIKIMEGKQKNYCFDGYSNFIDKELRRLRGNLEDIERRETEQKKREKRKKRG